jgi:hypothetical protein
MKSAEGEALGQVASTIDLIMFIGVDMGRRVLVMRRFLGDERHLRQRIVRAVAEEPGL